jgi:hypothetical protein
MDLTLQNFKVLLDLITSKGFASRTIGEYLTDREHSTKFLLLRHDVDCKAGRALQLAEIEAGKGIVGTFYFHGPHRPRFYDPGVVRTISQMGHEIGYHFETMDRAGGDFDKAKSLFEADIATLRGQGLSISTVCAHSNPFHRKVGYTDNRDLISQFPDLLEQNGIRGEAYTSLTPDFNRIWSVFDTRTGLNGFAPARLMRSYLQNPEFNAIYLAIHPHFWARTRVGAFAGWASAKLFDLLGLKRALQVGKSFH